jgi:integrase
MCLLVSWQEAIEPFLNTLDSPHHLVALALGTGLRAAELTAVKASDIISDGDGADWLRVVQGKGRKDRLVPLALDVAGAGWR